MGPRPGHPAVWPLDRFAFFISPGDACRRRPTPADAGRQRPTPADASRRGPTQTDAGRRRPTQADAGRRRSMPSPKDAKRHRRRPTPADAGRRRPISLRRALTLPTSLGVDGSSVSDTGISSGATDAGRRRMTPTPTPADAGRRRPTPADCGVGPHSIPTCQRVCSPQARPRASPSMLKLRSGVCEINARALCSVWRAPPRAPHFNVVSLAFQRGFCACEINARF